MSCRRGPVCLLPEAEPSPQPGCPEGTSDSSLSPLPGSPRLCLCSETDHGNNPSRCTVRWHRVPSWCCVTVPTICLSDFSIFQTETVSPLTTRSPLPPPCSPGPPQLSFLCLWTLGTWNHAALVPLCPAYFKIFPKSQSFLCEGLPLTRDGTGFSSHCGFRGPMRPGAEADPSCVPKPGGSPPWALASIEALVMLMDADTIHQARVRVWWTGGCRVGVAVAAATWLCAVIQL